MKIIIVCISLGLVACTRGQIKSYIDDYFRLFGVESGGRWLRSTARDSQYSKKITGHFYLPASSGGNQGGRGASSNFQDLDFQDLGAGAGSLSNQVGNGAANSNYFQGWGTRAGDVSNQGGSAGGSISNIQAWGAGASGFSNQGSSGAADGSNFQGWTPIDNGVSNQGGSGRVGDSSLTGPIGSAGGFSLPNDSTGEGSYRRPSFIRGGAGGGSFQAYSGNAVSVSNQGGNEGTGGSNFQGWRAGAGGVSNQGKSGCGGKSLPSPIGNAAGFQGYSKGPVSSNNRGARSGAGGFSNQGSSGLVGYQNAPISSMTSEGRNIDPQLLEQIRFILLQEEASSGLGGGASPSSSSFSAPSSSYGAPSTSFGAPSSAYGAPSAETNGGIYGRGESSRVVGIVFEGIYQSIQIAEKHQTTSELGPSRAISPLMTSPIPSRSFNSP